MLYLTCSASLTFHHDNIIIIFRIPRSFYKEISLYKIKIMRVNWWKPTGLLAYFEVALFLRPDLSMSVEVNVFFFSCFSLVGVFVFSLLTVLGSSIFALGSHFKGSPYLLPMMLTGRLLFGSGNGSLTSKEFKFLIIPHQRAMMYFYFAY